MKVCKPHAQETSVTIVFAVTFPLFFIYIIYTVHSFSRPSPIGLYIIYSLFIIGPILCLMFYIFSVQYDETGGKLCFTRSIGNRVFSVDEMTAVRIRTMPYREYHNGPLTTVLIFKFIAGKKSVEVSQMDGLSDLVDALQKANPKIEVVRP